MIVHVKPKKSRGPWWVGCVTKSVAGAGGVAEEREFALGGSSRLSRVGTMEYRLLVNTVTGDRMSPR